MKYRKIKNEILRLHSEGNSYRQIEIELKCSKGAISYHLGSGQKEKHKNNNQQRKILLHPYYRKIEKFLSRKINSCCELKYCTTIQQRLYKKIIAFFKDRITKRCETMTFSVDDVISKIGKNPVCYLTGERIDINNTKTYHFDHIVPTSKGGTNDLDNLGICTKKANMSKCDMTPQELIDFCKSVLIHNGFEVKKADDERFERSTE